MTSVRVACVQLNAKADLTVNLDEAEHWIRLARADGAEFIATPENTSGMYRNKAPLFDSPLPEEGHPATIRFATLAKEIGATLLLGSISVKLDSGKLANRSVLFSPTSTIAINY